MHVNKCHILEVGTRNQKYDYVMCDEKLWSSYDHEFSFPDHENTQVSPPGQGSVPLKGMKVYVMSEILVLLLRRS